MFPAKEKSKQVNEPVAYENPFIIKNVNGADEYFLHWDSSMLYLGTNEYRDSLVLPISASHGSTSATDWQFSKYFVSTKGEGKKGKKTHFILL